MQNIEPTTHFLLSAREILDDIGYSHSFQRKQKAKKYVGLQIDWHVVYAGISSIAGDGVDVIVNPEGFRKTSILCKFSINKYPQLKAIQTGTPVKLTGTIKDIDPASETIRLADTTLFLVGPKKSA